MDKIFYYYCSYNDPKNSNNETIKIFNNVTLIYFKNCRQHSYDTLAFFYHWKSLPNKQVSQDCDIFYLDKNFAYICRKV